MRLFLFCLFFTSAFSLSARAETYRVTILSGLVSPLKKNRKCWDYCANPYGMAQIASAVRKKSEAYILNKWGRGIAKHIADIPTSGEDVAITTGTKVLKFILKKKYAMVAPHVFICAEIGKFALRRITKITQFPDPVAYLHISSPAGRKVYFSYKKYIRLRYRVRRYRKKWWQRRWKRITKYAWRWRRVAVATTYKEPNTISPRWNQSFMIHTSGANNLYIVVKDFDARYHDYIGRITIPLYNFPKGKWRFFCGKGEDQLYQICISVRNFG